MADVGKKLRFLLRLSPAQVGHRARLKLQGRLDRVLHELGHNRYQVDGARFLQALGPAQNDIAERWLNQRDHRFFFQGTDPMVRKRIAEHYTPDMNQAVERADLVCRNTFDYLGSGPVQFPEAIDWGHSPVGKVEWTNILNKFRWCIDLAKAYWWTGDRHYAAQFQAVTTNWITANPPGTSHSWGTMTVAVRAVSLLWAVHYFSGTACLGTDFILRLLQSLSEHAAYLERNLSLDSADNHVMFECRALIFLGLTLPGSKAKRWCDAGLRVLRAQLRRQVDEEGLQQELSPHYQLVLFREIYEAVHLAELNGCDVADIDLVLQRMGQAMSFLTMPDGDVPMLNDAYLKSELFDPKDVFAVSALRWQLPKMKYLASNISERVYWLVGEEGHERFSTLEASTPEERGKSFSSGYHVVRSNWSSAADYTVFDAAPFGMLSSPAHGHADALNLVICVNGRPVLIDPGVYQYEAGKWRSFFRGTQAHNTVMIDGLSSSEIFGATRVGRVAGVENSIAYWGNDFSVFEASHDGYERLDQPALHQRTVVCAYDDWWLVVDRVTGTGVHEVEQLWHFSPIHICQTDGVWCASYPDGSGLRVLPILQGDATAEVVTGEEQEPQGWVSFANGYMEPAPVLRIRTHQPLPVMLVTLLAATRPGEAVPELQTSPDGTLVISRHNHTDFISLNQTQESITVTRHEAGGVRRALVVTAARGSRTARVIEG